MRGAKTADGEITYKGRPQLGALLLRYGASVIFFEDPR